MVNGGWKMPEADHKPVMNVTDMPVHQLCYQLALDVEKVSRG